MTALYVDLYPAKIPNASLYYGNDSHFYPPAYVEDLVAKAHARGIQIYAIYGAPEWTAGVAPDGVTPAACDTTPPSFEHERMADVASYNEAYAAYPSAQLDGVALDVEPPDPTDLTAPAPADPITLTDLYSCLHSDLQSYGLKMVVALRWYWSVPMVLTPTLALNPDAVVVDGYRDAAGAIDPGAGTCLTYGILCRDWPMVLQANSTGQGASMLAGLETTNCDAGGNSNCAGSPDISFYDSGQDALDTQAQTVTAALETSTSTFGGFAVDSYGSAYLGGQTTPDWPAVNPELAAGGGMAGTIYSKTTTLLQELAGSTGTLQSVSFPAGAISGPATLSVVPSTGAPTTGTLQALGQTFTFTVTDSSANIIHTFNQPVTLTFGLQGQRSARRGQPQCRDGGQL